MPFKKITEKAFINKHVKVKLPDIYTHLKKIRSHSSVLAICPTPTKYNWLGVNKATHNLFPGSTFDIPQYYSKTVYNEKELREITKLIVELRFEKVVFSGFCSYFESIIEIIKTNRTGISIQMIYHGSLSELAGNSNMKSDFAKIIQLLKNKKIDKIAFVKKGLNISMQKIFGIEAYSIVLPPPDISGIELARLHNRQHLHIGVFANNQLRKNVHNQIASALMIENALVHTTDKYEYSYFNCDERIIDHSSGLPWNEFMFLMSQMDINLYNTYTETWGQIVIESLALGVPCLTNNSSGVLDYDNDLKEILVVKEHDNPAAIADRLNTVFENMDTIISMSHNYVHLLKEIATEKMKKFLEV